MRRVTFLIVALSFTQMAYAGVWSGNKTILSIEVVNTGGFLIHMSSQISPGCTQASTDGSTLYVYANQNSVTDAGAQAMLASTLAAFTSGKQITVFYDDTDPHCWAKFIVIK